MQIKNSEVMRSDPWYLEWRLVGAYVFYTISLFDFIGGPLITILFDGYTKGTLVWTPLTTQGGGLFYFAYGGILGISAWGKFNENKEIIKIGQDNPTPEDTPSSNISVDTTTTIKK
jgi:hypothetical protein